MSISYHGEKRPRKNVNIVTTCGSCSGTFYFVMNLHSEPHRPPSLRPFWTKAGPRISLSEGGSREFARSRRKRACERQTFGTRALSGCGR
jgi:hypothetical protein